MAPQVWHNTPYWISFRAANQFGDYTETSARQPLIVDLTPPEAGAVRVGQWEYYQYLLEDMWFPDAPEYWEQVLECVRALPTRIAEYADCVCWLNTKIHDLNCGLGYGPPLCPAQRLQCPSGTPDPGPRCRLCHWDPNFRHRRIWGDRSAIGAVWYGFDDPEARIVRFEVAAGTGCGLGRESNVVDWVDMGPESEAESAEAPWQMWLDMPEVCAVHWGVWGRCGIVRGMGRGRGSRDGRGRGGTVRCGARVSLA